jgi:hypothetical protein
MGDRESAGVLLTWLTEGDGRAAAAVVDAGDRPA